MDSVVSYSIVGLLSTLIQIICYADISCRCESWINFATLPLVSSIVLNGILELLSLSTLGVDGSLYAYSYCQLCYAAVSVAYVVGIRIPPPRLAIFQSLKLKGNLPATVPWFFLALGILIYLPVLITYRAYLTDPRVIYSSTASGFGFQFFISAMFTTVAWASFLFVKRGWPTTILFFSICMVMLYLHGSKGQLISLLAVSLLYQVYVLDKKVAIKMFIPLVIAGLIVFSAIFYALSSNISPQEIVVAMENYSDYTRNAMIVIDNPAITKGPYYGQLTLEDEYYPRVPRFLDPNKPKEYGDGRLERLFFPERFDELSGSPAFGIGVPYADFGIFAVVWIFGSTVWITWITMGFLRLFRKNPNPGLFLVILFLSGISILALGIGFLLPEMILLGYAVNLAFKLANMLGFTGRLSRLRKDYQLPRRVLNSRFIR